MKEFMARPIDFGDPPAGATGWSEQTQCAMGEGKITKTVTRTYNMSDGSTKVVEKSESIDA